MGNSIIGHIGKEEVEYFTNFLLEDSVAAIRSGNPQVALGVSEDGVACGAIAGVLKEHVFIIKSLYISPDYRGKGYGSDLLDFLRYFLRNHTKVQGIMISYTITEEEHLSLQPFLEKAFFQQEEDWGRTIYGIKLKDVKESPLYDVSSVCPSHIIPFTEISTNLLENAAQNAQLAEVPLPESSLTSDKICKELSCAVMEKDKVKGFAVVDYSFAGHLTLSSIWTEECGIQQLPVLLKIIMNKAYEVYSEDTCVYFQAVNSSSVKLVKSLVPMAIPVSKSFCLWL